ncbi:MAG: hypothetical protein IKR48_03250 [Kiritimatiellae bacterium]|nr:hypothetical protein [Kiritimatiellia bacterium]
MKTKILFSVLLAGAISAQAELKHMATVRVASVDKLGAAISKICTDFGQPMAGAMGIGFLQQGLQQAVGTFDQTKPGAILLYLEDKNLPTEPDELVSSLTEHGTIAAIIPLLQEEQAYAAARKLVSKGNGIFEMADGNDKKLAAFQGKNLVIAPKEDCIVQAKADCAKVLGALPGEEALAIELTSDGLSVLQKIATNYSENEAAKSRKAAKDGKDSFASLQELAQAEQLKDIQKIGQFSAYHLGIGYEANGGLFIAWNGKAKPGTEMAQTIADTKPFNQSLLEKIPDDSVLYMVTSQTDDQVRKLKVLLPEFIKIVKKEAGEEFKDLTDALESVLNAAVDGAALVQESAGALGYTADAKLYGITKAIAKPGKTDEILDAVRSINRQLVQAVDKAIAGQKVLTVSEDGLTTTLDFSKAALAQFITVVNDKYLKGDDKIPAEKIQENAQELANVLQTIFGEVYVNKTVKDADGSILRFGTANPPALKSILAGGARAKAAYQKAGKPLTQFCWFSFCRAINKVAEISKSAKEPIEGAEVLNALAPMPNTDGFLFYDAGVNGKMQLSSGEAQGIMKIVETMKANNDDDDNKDKEEKKDK